MPRLSFAGDIGDIQHLKLRYAFDCKVTDKEGKAWKGFVSRIWNLKAQPLLPKQSVNFKCQIWFEITKKLFKKCLDASSL